MGLSFFCSAFRLQVQLFQSGRPRSILFGLLIIPTPAPTTPPTSTPGGPPMRPIPAPMPAPERPRSATVVPQPQSSVPTKITNPMDFILHPLQKLTFATCPVTWAQAWRGGILAMSPLQRVRAFARALLNSGYETTSFDQSRAPWYRY